MKESRSKHSFSGQSRISKVKVESKNIWGNPESAEQRKKTRNPEKRKSEKAEKRHRNLKRKQNNRADVGETRKTQTYFK